MMRVAGLVLVLLALGPSALVATETAAFAAGHSLVPGLEGVFGPVCHHDPARTLLVLERPLSVCARCTGLWNGAALGGLFGALVPLRRGWIGVSAGTALGLGGLGLVTAIAEALSLLATPLLLRLVLGAFLGAAVPTVASLGGRLLVRLQ